MRIAEYSGVTTLKWSVEESSFLKLGVAGVYSSLYMVWVTAHPSQRFHGGGVNYGMSGRS
jgi:hypothetical protein